MTGSTRYHPTSSGPFSKSESDHLAKYLAEVLPKKKGRAGNKVYQDLVNNPDKWPWGRSRSAQSWRQHYINNEPSFDLWIKRMNKNISQEQENREEQGGSKDMPGKIPETNSSTQNRDEGMKGESLNSNENVNTDWVNDSAAISRTEDLPRQQSKAIIPSTTISNGSPSNVKATPDAKVDSPGAGRASILAPPSQPSSRMDSNSEDQQRGRNERGYHTPPPSRSRSLEIEAADQRLSSPASGTAADGDRDDRRMNTHDDLWFDVVSGPKISADFITGRNLSQRSSTKDKDGGSQAQDREEHRAVNSGRPSGSSQTPAVAPEASPLPPSSSQGSHHPSGSRHSPDIISGLSKGKDQDSDPFIENEDTSNEAEREVEQEVHTDQEEVDHCLDDIDIDTDVDLLGGYGLTQPTSGADKEHSTRSDREQGSQGQKDDGKVIHDRTRVIFPETSSKSMKRKKPLGIMHDTEYGGSSVVDNAQKRPRRGLFDLNRTERDQQKRIDERLFQDTWSTSASTSNARIHSSSRHDLGLRPIDSHLGHRRRHTFGGSVPPALAPLPIPPRILSSPGNLTLANPSSALGPHSIITTPTGSLDHHSRAALQRSGASTRTSTSFPSAPPSYIYSSASGSPITFPPPRPRRPLDLSSVSEEDVTLSIQATLGSLAAMHEFSIDEVRNVWEETGSLVGADKILGEMRIAADAAKQRALSLVRSVQSSRAASVSLGRGTDSRLGSASKSLAHPLDRGSSVSLGTSAEKRARSSLSKTIIASSENEDEGEQQQVDGHSANASTPVPVPVAQAPIAQSEAHAERSNESTEVRRRITFYPSPGIGKRPSDALNPKRKETTWTEEEDAIIREADPVKLKELAKLKGSKEVRRRAIELATI